MREGASGANTSSCNTVPVKLEAGAFFVGRVDARMTRERMFLSFFRADVALVSR
jgi:hypothetical protein